MAGIITIITGGHRAESRMSSSSLSGEWPATEPRDVGVPTDAVMRDVVETEIAAATRPYGVNDAGAAHHIDVLADRHPPTAEGLGGRR